jgi:hypothetical protein
MHHGKCFVAQSYCVSLQARPNKDRRFAIHKMFETSLILRSRWSRCENRQTERQHQKELGDFSHLNTIQVSYSFRIGRLKEVQFGYRTILTNFTLKKD